MTCIPEEVESKMIGKLLLAAAAVFVSAVVCDPLFSRLEYRQSRKNSKKLRIGKNNLYNGFPIHRYLLRFISDIGNDQRTL